MHGNLFKVLMLWLAISITVNECNTIKGRLPQTSIISNFVKNFIQPYIQSLQLPNPPVQKSILESPMEKAINRVVAKLKPFLLDEDGVNDDKETVDSNDETTIIEFLPKRDALREGKEPNSELETKIHKYEKIKYEIKAALEKESVSERTKHMVIKTLSNLITQLIEKQCTWKSIDHSTALFRTGKNAKHIITLKEWEDLKKQYFNFLEFKHNNSSVVLFNEFHKFFSKVINDTQTLSKQYKIKCQLINDAANDKTALRKWTEDSCEDCKICSEELKGFLLDFYKSLNDTAVSVFKNYAAMYTRDVIADDDDSTSTDIVPNILHKISYAAERRVSKVFIKEIDRLSLDKKKDQASNIKIMKGFIGITAMRVFKHINKHIASDLVSLPTRLLLAVKKDVSSNLDVDLGNVENDMKARICTVFLTCNGKVFGNRRTMVGHGKPRLNSNSVYVKVQLSFDDRLKDAIFQNNEGLFTNIKAQSREDITNYQPGEEVRRYNNVNVTRTSILTTSTTKYSISNVKLTTGSILTTGNRTAVLTEDIMKNSILEKFK